MASNRLNRLHRWCVDNSMTVNARKSKVMHITRSRHISPPDYHLGQIPLETTNTFQYLGLIIDAKLTWTTHVDSVVARANRLLGFIRTVARGSSPNAIFSLYKSLVLPILEYGLPAWHPHTSAQKNKLERVQRTATRLALHQRRGEMSYEDRLQQLNWHPLTHRRNYVLSSFVFRVLHGVTLCESIRNNTVINPRHPDSLTFSHLPARTDLQLYSPSRRFPRLWDAIPPHIRDAAVVCPLPTFLRQLKDVLLNPD